MAPETHSRQKRAAILSKRMAIFVVAALLLAAAIAMIYLTGTHPGVAG